MEEIKLSIIVAVYNAEKFLDECITSLVNQTLSNYEVILVNDGSKDNSAAICARYAHEYPFIKFLEQENQGRMKATIKGIENASGRYIGFVDSDDFVSESTFKTMIDAAIREDADIVSMAGVRFCGKIEKPFQDKLKSGVYDRKQIEDYIIPNIFSNHDLYGNRGIQPSQSLKIFKRNLIVETYKLIPTDIEIGEDLLTSFTAIAHSNKFVILDNNLIGYHYRLNPNSQSWSHKNNLFNKSMRLCKSLRNIHTLVDNEVFQREVDYEVCFFAINAFLNEYLMENKASAKERKKVLASILDCKELKEALKRINVKDVKMPNTLFIKKMQKNNLNSLHRIGMVISTFRKPITRISQKFI